MERDQQRGLTSANPPLSFHAADTLAKVHVFQASASYLQTNPKTGFMNDFNFNFQLKVQVSHYLTTHAIQLSAQTEKARDITLPQKMKDLCILPVHHNVLYTINTTLRVVK